MLKLDSIYEFLSARLSIFFEDNISFQHVAVWPSENAKKESIPLSFKSFSAFEARNVSSKVINTVLAQSPTGSDTGYT